MRQRAIAILIGLVACGLLACLGASFHAMLLANAAWSPSGPGEYVRLKARATLFGEVAVGLTIAAFVLLAAHAHGSGLHREEEEEDGR